MEDYYPGISCAAMFLPSCPPVNSTRPNVTFSLDIFGMNFNSPKQVCVSVCVCTCITDIQYMLVLECELKTQSLFSLLRLPSVPLLYDLFSAQLLLATLRFDWLLHSNPTLHPLTLPLFFSIHNEYKPVKLT